MAEYVNYVDLSDLQTDGMGAVVSQHIYRISKNISYLYWQIIPKNYHLTLGQHFSNFVAADPPTILGVIHGLPVNMFIWQQYIAYTKESMSP